MRNKIILLSIAVMMITGVSMAQKADCNNSKKEQATLYGIQDLTPEQEKAIQTIKKDMHSVQKNLKAERDIKEAELNKLLIQDKADLKAIDAKIDEITAIRAQMEKNRVHANMNIRQLLNEDQKMQFDHKTMGQNKARCAEGEGQMPENKPCGHNDHQNSGEKAPGNHKECPHSQDKK
ncbi:MAG: periplasmic heavy metal sensor [Bacteroidales bacterium]|nr:periplasmic heavy metal sensor [Bacteroidales bacterium]HOY38075.1 periplasmic heavy metal sensor [Bacteroidales bacterium]